MAQVKRIFINIGCSERLYHAFQEYKKQTRLSASVIAQMAIERYLIDESIDRYPEVFKLLDQES